MLFDDETRAMVAETSAVRRRKGRRRRLGRDARIAAPMIALGTAVLVLAMAIVAAEMVTALSDDAYLTTSSSSTSNVSTAPP